MITTIAGNGTYGYTGNNGQASAAELSYPSTVAIDGSGNVYFSDKNNNVIRKINTSGVITTVAGNGYGAGSVTGSSGGYSGDNGPATDAELFYPWAVAIDRYNNLYIADRGNNVVRKVDTSGIISAFAGKYSGSGAAHGSYSGDGGPATNAGLYFPSGVAVDGYGSVYIGDSYNNVIRKVATSGIISTFAGNHFGGYYGDGGAATAATLDDPYGIAFDATGNVYIADFGNYCIRKVDTSGIISTFAGNHVFGYSGDGGLATAASLGTPNGVTVDGPGNVYCTDANNSVVRIVNTAGIINTCAGDGAAGFSDNGVSATTAMLNAPLGVATDGVGNLYIADASNSMIRLVSPAATKVNQVSNAATSVKVFPDPNSGTFTVNLSSPNDEIAQITITNILGEKLKEFSVSTNKPMVITLNEPPGTYSMYFISAVTKEGTCSGKVVVE